MEVHDLERKKGIRESTYHVIRPSGWIGRVKSGGIGGMAILDDDSLKKKQSCEGVAILRSRQSAAGQWGI